MLLSSAKDRIACHSFCSKIKINSKDLNNLKKFFLSLVEKVILSIKNAFTHLGHCHPEALYKEGVLENTSTFFSIKLQSEGLQLY